MLSAPDQKQLVFKASPKDGTTDTARYPVQTAFPPKKDLLRLPL